MAFSTQKEFFHVPFMNETVDYECRRACVKLKTYQSTTDDRSWAMDESLQSRFLSDLVTCQTPVGGFGIGDDDEYESDEAGPAGGQRRINRNNGRGGDGRGDRGKHAADGNRYSASAGMGGDVGSSGPSGSGRGGGYAPQYGYRQAAYIGSGGVGHGGGASGGGGGVAGKQGQGGLVTADSVLACANEQMGRLQDLLLDKQKLEKQLEVSNERLKVANMENDKIKAIMNDRFDSNHAKDFYNKIQKLATSGKINRSEENELLHIYNKFEDMNKAYEVLQAENAHLKRLMEKLSLRASYEAIKMEPEKSNDVPFLQNEVNKLRQEVSMLRKYEDDKLKGRTDSNRNKSPDVDPDTLKAIITERNALREKCKTFKDLEARVYELQKIANEADKMSEHIVKMEHEMKKMQDYYEDQMGKLKFNEEFLKCQLDEMKEDLIRARCSAQKAECLQMEISCLRNELMRRDRSLNDYDCQYKQLMNVIDELQGNAIQNLHDTQTQTCADYMEDLTFFARATLSEIKKELRKRGGDGDKIGGGGIFDGHAITDGLSPEECCAEMRRLQDIVKQLTKQNEILQSNVKKAAEDLCADALKKLEEMEEKYKKAQDDIANLKKDKDDLNMRAINKLHEFSDRVDKLDSDVGETAKDTAGMDKDLKESMKLVREISDIHLKNAELSNAVHAITTRDDEKLIDDLRRQLLEEQAKNNKCQEENKHLQDALVKRGIDPDLVKKDLVKGTDDAQKEGPGVERVGRGADQDTQRRGPGGGLVGQREGPGVSEDDRRGGFGVGQDDRRGGPDAGKDDRKVGSGAGKDGLRDERRGGQDERRGEGPGAVQDAQRGGPDAGHDDQKGEPGAGQDDRRGKGPGVGQDAQKRGPGAGKDAQRGGPDAGRDDQQGGPGAGQDDRRGKGPGVGQDAQRGGPGAGKDAQRGGPDSGQYDQNAVPGAGQDDRKGKGPGAGPDAQRGGRGAGQDDQKGGPGAGQDDQKGGRGAGQDDQKGGPGAGQDDRRGKGPGVGQDAQRGGPGAVKDAQRGGPVASQDDQRSSPGAGQDTQRGSPDAGLEEQSRGRTGPGTGQKDRPGAGKYDGPGAGQKGEPGAGKDGGPTTGQGGEPGDGKRTGPIAGMEGSPATVREGGPNASRKDGSDVGMDGGPDASRKGGPGTEEVGGSDDLKRDDGAGRDGVPGVSGPSTGTPGSPTAAAGPSGADGATAGPTGDGSAVGGGITGGGTRGITDATGNVHGVGGGSPGRLQMRSGASPSGGGGKGRKGKISDAPGDDAFQQFIDVNATTMMSNIKAGSALEKELRGILNAFMMECGFCFCKSLVPKSKFYALCHKLLHSGIQCMSFRELAYMHRKVFMAADKLHPGCLLNMILTEQGFKDGERLKCCHCKNALCCSNSAEMLKEKVYKLERDIEMAKEHLDSLRVQSRSPKSPCTTRGKTYRQMEDSYSEAVEELLTCRETKLALSKTTSKHMKTLKARIMKCSDLMR